MMNKNKRPNLRVVLSALFLGGTKVTVHVLDWETPPGSPEGYFVIKRRVPFYHLERFAEGGEVFASVTDRKLHSEFHPGFQLGDKKFAFQRKESWTSLKEQWQEPLPVVCGDVTKVESPEV